MRSLVVCVYSLGTTFLKHSFISHELQQVHELFFDQTRAVMRNLQSSKPYLALPFCCLDSPDLRQIFYLPWALVLIYQWLLYKLDLKSRTWTFTYSRLPWVISFLATRFGVKIIHHIVQIGGFEFDTLLRNDFRKGGGGAQSRSQRLSVILKMQQIRILPNYPFILQPGYTVHFISTLPRFFLFMSSPQVRNLKIWRLEGVKPFFQP